MPDGDARRCKTRSSVLTVLGLRTVLYSRRYLLYFTLRQRRSTKNVVQRGTAHTMLIWTPPPERSVKARR